MSAPRRPPASWGDLLRFLSLPHAAGYAADAARLLGLPLIVLPERTVHGSEERKQQKHKSATPAPAAAQARLPLRCPQGFNVRIERGSSSAQVQPMALPDWGPEEAAAVDQMLDLKGEPAAPLPTLLDIPRLQARWRSALQLRKPGPLDIDRMVEALAQNQWPAPLPQRSRAYRLRDLHLCVDLHPDRQWLRDDYVACITRLVAARADARIRVHAIDHSEGWPAAFDALGPASAVLMLAEPALMSLSEQRDWCRREVRLVAQGVSVLWSLEWQPGAGALLRMGRERLQNSRELFDADVSLLLACLAPALTVEPALVRGMAQALRLPRGLALEHAVWTHPDLDGALPFRQWHPGPQREHLQQLKQQSADVIDACWRVLAEAHVHRSQVQRDEELLNWGDAAGEGGVTRGGIALAFNQAKSRYARVVQHLLHLRDHAEDVGLARKSSPGVIRAAATQRLNSLPESLGADRAQLERLLLQAAQPSDTAKFSRSSMPADDDAGPLSVWLFQQGQRLLLVPIDFVGPGAHMTALAIDPRWLIVECEGVRRVIWRPRDALIQEGLIVLTEWGRALPKSVRVRGVTDQLRIDAVQRPHWAAEFATQPAWAGRWVTDRSNMGWGTDGLFHWPDGQPVVMEPSPVEGVVYNTPNGWQFEVDRHGPRLSFDVARKQVSDAERVYFRYIPPGTFLQGSPRGVGHSDEHPQHPVTFTQGLWLAETPCTQALWQAVMGKNPSHFKDGADAPGRPVENVSWDDVTAFLEKLQPLLPSGCEAVLPNESQWEYACRAGTQTEYWWGDKPDGAKVNVDMTGERQIDDQDGTTPVDRYPPNPWGFYDMHGNVWEWCADGMRDYAAELARDPQGPGTGESRMVRGGSWFDHPGFARAAFRRRWHRWYAYLPLGFRFALRSPGGPEPRPGGPGASRRGGAAGGRTDGADYPPEQFPPEEAPSDFFSLEGLEE
jgi:formylglycine-generating enzyme required for sulfatase activity